MSVLAGYFCMKKELQVHLILYGKIPELFYEVPDNLCVHKPVTIFNNKLRFIYTIGRLFYLRQSVKKINPDSVLSFGEYWNSFVLLALWGLPIPIYISDRCSPEKKFGMIQDILRKWLYPRSKGVIAQTKIAKSIYDSQFKNDNICIIGNPIHLRSASETNPKKENIVLTIGRLIESKNHDKLIELFCNINHPDWKLVIVGGDALRQNNMIRLNKLISSLNAESKIILTGYRNDLYRLYQKSKIFAFTSYSEGFPNVIGEAMEAGLPVVSFDCIAGPSEMITDGEDGYLIPVGNYGLFRERLEQLMVDASLCKKIGSKARKSIQKFSLENIGAKYYNFIIAN